MKRQARSRQARQAVRMARRRAAGMAVAVLVLLGTGAMALERLLDPASFPVRTLRLGGELAHIDRAQVRDLALAHAAGGFLRVDVDGMRAAVGALPWVREAAVRRVWPDIIEVEVREHRALAQWRGSALLSEQGVLFSPPRAQWPEGLPAFTGPDGSAAGVVQRYRELHGILGPVGLTVVSLEMSERRALRLGLDNGLMVLLGRDDPQARLERFVRVYPKALEQQAAGIMQVDLRYTNGFAVAWKKAAPAV
ncbi:MAG: cell division protein FtsQ/DivIB [Thiohalomonadaceae bacterium]